MEKINLFKILESEGRLQTIWLYPATETLDDPYEKTTTLSFLNPLPIKAIVEQISFEALRWKFWGQIPSGSIKVISEKKNMELFRIADKIEYNNNKYRCYKDDSKGFAILERGDYIIAILERING